MTPLDRATTAVMHAMGDGPGSRDRLRAEAIARAVLKAIRDPGNDVYQDGFNAEVAANPHKTQPHHVVPAVWEAMIDAILDGPKSSDLTPG